MAPSTIASASTADGRRGAARSGARRPASAARRQRPALAAILVVEDDPDWARVLVDALTDADYEVRHTASALAARGLAAEEPPDLVLLDLILPDGDGLVLCTDLKSSCGAPVLVCSASKRRYETVLALKLGADDVVPKPCNLDELVARVEALLRNRPASTPDAAPGHSLRYGALEVDRRGHRASLGAATVHLTPAEHRLLSVLVEHAEGVVTREQLARSVYASADTGRALDMLVRRLRAKLQALGVDAPRVETVRGLGFGLVSPA